MEQISDLQYIKSRESVLFWMRFSITIVMGLLAAFGLIELVRYLIVLKIYDSIVIWIYVGIFFVCFPFFCYFGVVKNKTIPFLIFASLTFIPTLAFSFGCSMALLYHNNGRFPTLVSGIIIYGSIITFIAFCIVYGIISKRIKKRKNNLIIPS